jgi:hypothetical protein
MREDCCNRPDDMDTHPDALTHEVRIVIQIQPSGSQSAMVWTRVQQIWKLRVEDQPFGRPSPMVRTRDALYGIYLQRTCDRPDNSASPSGRSSQTGKIFSENIRILVAQLSV